MTARSDYRFVAAEASRAESSDEKLAHEASKALAEIDTLREAIEVIRGWEISPIGVLLGDGTHIKSATSLLGHIQELLAAKLGAAGGPAPCPSAARDRHPFLAGLEQILHGEDEAAVTTALDELDAIMDMEDIALRFGTPSDADVEAMRAHFARDRRLRAIGEAVERAIANDNAIGALWLAAGVSPKAAGEFIAGFNRGWRTALDTVEAAGSAVTGVPEIVLPDQGEGDREPSSVPADVQAGVR